MSTRPTTCGALRRASARGQPLPTVCCLGKDRPALGSVACLTTHPPHPISSSPPDPLFPLHRTRLATLHPPSYGGTSCSSTAQGARTSTSASHAHGGTVSLHQSLACTIVAQTGSVLAFHFLSRQSKMSAQTTLVSKYCRFSNLICHIPLDSRHPPAFFIRCHLARPHRDRRAGRCHV